jgi:hypothetical protein
MLEHRHIVKTLLHFPIHPKIQPKIININTS